MADGVAKQVPEDLTHELRIALQFQSWHAPKKHLRRKLLGCELPNGVAQEGSQLALLLLDPVQTVFDARRAHHVGCELRQTFRRPVDLL